MRAVGVHGGKRSPTFHPNACARPSFSQLAVGRPRDPKHDRTGNMNIPPCAYLPREPCLFGTHTYRLAWGAEKKNRWPRSLLFCGCMGLLQKRIPNRPYIIYTQRPGHGHLLGGWLRFLRRSGTIRGACGHCRRASRTDTIWVAWVTRLH